MLQTTTPAAQLGSRLAKAASADVAIAPALLRPPQVVQSELHTVQPTPDAVRTEADQVLLESRVRGSHSAASVFSSCGLLTTCAIRYATQKS